MIKKINLLIFFPLTSHQTPFLLTHSFTPFPFFSLPFSFLSFPKPGFITSIHPRDYLADLTHHPSFFVLLLPLFLTSAQFSSRACLR